MRLLPTCLLALAAARAARCRARDLRARPRAQLRALRGAALRHLDAARPLRPDRRPGRAGPRRAAAAGWRCASLPPTASTPACRSSTRGCARATCWPARPTRGHLRRLDASASTATERQRAARRAHAARHQPGPGAARAALRLPHPPARCSARSAAAISKANSSAAISAPASACPSSPTGCACWCRWKASASSGPPGGALQASGLFSDCHRSTSIITTPTSITAASDTSFSLSTTGTQVAEHAAPRRRWRRRT